MSGQPDQFADELRLISDALMTNATCLRMSADRAQGAADEFDRVVEERDELRAEVARMRDVIRPLRADMAEADIDDHYQVEDLRGAWVLRLDAALIPPYYRAGGGS